MNRAVSYGGHEPSNPLEAVAAFYEAISFAPGGEPSWERLRALFLGGARLVFPQMQNGAPLTARSVDEWLADFEESIRRVESRGLRESELRAEVVEFRDTATVISASESRFEAEDPEPFLRGLNSFQLVRVDGAWRIASVLWDIEGAGYHLPDRFLRAAGRAE